MVEGMAEGVQKKLVFREEASTEVEGDTQVYTCMSDKSVKEVIGDRLPMSHNGWLTRSEYAVYNAQNFRFYELDHECLYEVLACSVVSIHFQGVDLIQCRKSVHAHNNITL